MASLFVLVNMTVRGENKRRWGRIPLRNSEDAQAVTDTIVANSDGRVDVVLHENRSDGRVTTHTLLFSKEGNRLPQISRWTDLVDVGKHLPTYPLNTTYVPEHSRPDNMVVVGKDLQEAEFSFGTCGKASVLVRATVTSTCQSTIECVVSRLSSKTVFDTRRLSDAVAVANFFTRGYELATY